MKTLWVLVSVLLCTGTFATEVQKSKTCTGASCSPSLTTPYIVNDINSDSSSSKLVKPVVLDASQSRLGLHLQASNIVPPTTPGAIPATSFYDPLDDDAGNPVVLNTPPKLPLLEGHDLSGDTTEVEDQQLLDAIKGTYTLTPPAGDVQSFTDAIKQQAEAELAAQDGMVSTGSALGDATLSGGSSTDTSAAGSGTGMSDAAMEAAMAATVPGSSNSAATPSETQIDAQLARISKNDPRLGGLVAVEQTAQAQAAVMKRAAAILKLLDKAYGELGAKLAAVATQRTALRHQYLNTREYLHALHLHALKLLKEDTDVPYTPADLSTSNTPAAQFLNGLPASAASMTSAGAILAKIQDLLLAASGQTLVASGSAVADNSGCCGNDPISRELQALINGGATTGGETTTTGNTGGELPPFSSTAFVQSLIPPSSTGSETPTPEPSSTASSVVTGGTTTPVASTVDVVASTGGGGGTQTSSSAAAMMLIDDAEFARIEHEAQEDLQEKERRREATAKKHRHKHHRDNEPDDVADISVKETAKSTDSSNEKTKSKTGMDDPRDWVKHFGELSKDAQTVSSIPAVPDPDHITLENLPILEAALTGKLPKADEAPHLDPLPQIPAVSLLETSSSTRSTAKVMEPNIAELMARVKSKMAQTNSIVAQLKALKDRNEHMDTDPQQRAAEAQELAALQRGEEVYSKSGGRSAPVRDSHTIKVTPTDMLSALRDLKEPDAASVHATDANFPSFDELGLLETKTTTKHHANAAAHKLPTQPADDSLGLPVFPSEPPMEVDPKVDQDIVAAAMAVEVRPHPHHRRRAASEGSFLEVDSTVKQGSDRNFRAEIAHQEHVLDQLHNKYSRSEYTDTLREVLGDPIMSAGGDFVGTSHVTRVQGGNHPRLVESIQSDLDRNANNMYQDVMAAARGEDGDDVLFSHDSDPMEFRQRKRGPSNGIGVMADVSASNINDKYVFPELDIPDLHLKTVKTPSAQLASLMNNGPQPADNVNELIETYKRSLEGPSDNEQQQWDDLEQLREHTTVTPSVQKLLNEAQIVLSGGSLSHPRSHYNNADLAGALSFIDEGLSHPIPKHHMTADEAYQRVLRVTNPGAPKKNVVTHHSNNHKRADDVSFIQEHTHTENHQQRKRHKEPDLHHAKDLSVEELTRLATRHIKAGEKEIRKIEDFQQELIAKDPAKFKDLEATHNLLHEPVVHHHHHSEPTAMLETSSTITSTKKHNHHDSTPVPDILIEQAARRATENAEDGIDALLAKAAGAIDQDQQLVKDMDGTHAKIRSIQKEYDAIRKSDASDMAVLRQEEELIAKTKSHGHQAKAADITNEQLSLLEDAATTMEHKGARRVKAKMDAQTEKRRRRKHGHHS